MANDSRKLTPGEWRYEVVGTGGKWDNPLNVCEITNGHTRIAEYVWEHDAPVLAASKELLHELRELAEKAHNHFTVPDSVWAVIAKAEGR